MLPDLPGLLFVTSQIYPSWPVSVLSTTQHSSRAVLPFLWPQGLRLGLRHQAVCDRIKDSYVMTHVSFFTLYSLRKEELRTIFSLYFLNSREAVVGRGRQYWSESQRSVPWSCECFICGEYGLIQSCQTYGTHAQKGTRKGFLGTQHSLLSHFLYFFAQLAPLYCEEYVYVHISDCLDIVYEVPLVKNNTASETFLHKSGAVRSGDWIFIIGAPAWRWLGECVTSDKTYYSLLFKQEVAAAPFTSTFSSVSHSLREPLLKI